VGAGGFAARAVFEARKSESFVSTQIVGAEALAPNSSLNFNYPTERESAILVRSANGEYHAYGQKCTHLACPVYYSRDDQRLECPCHEGAFDVATGNVLYGPPPRALDTIEIELRGSQVWAIGRKPTGGQHAS
jgi:nitrite reductase/ring-hydroxylating ferredoxin subunit